MTGIVWISRSGIEHLPRVMICRQDECIARGMDPERATSIDILMR